MIHTITHDGFHGCTRVRVSGQDRGGYVVVSQRTATRLNRQVCGCGGCKCGEVIASRNSAGTWPEPRDAWIVALPRTP